MATTSTSTTAVKKTVKTASKNNTAALEKRVDELEKRLTACEACCSVQKTDGDFVTWDDLKNVLGRAGGQYRALRNTIKESLRDGKLS